MRRQIRNTCEQHKEVINKSDVCICIWRKLYYSFILFDMLYGKKIMLIVGYCQ